MSPDTLAHASDDDSDAPSAPAGVRNYITPSGYQRLRAEWAQLIDVERPQVVEIVHWAASNGDRSENGDYLYGKKRLREIDRRIRFLSKRLECAEVTDPSAHHGGNQIFFGATVRYADEAGAQHCLTILGIDEADSAQSQVSWVSPMARALLKKQVGDVAQVPTPLGLREVEVLAVSYPAPQGAATPAAPQFPGP